jgi:hypothetical protein
LQAARYEQASDETLQAARYEQASDETSQARSSLAINSHIA